MPAILAAVLSGSVQEIPYGELRNGTATYYSWADGTGNCMFDAVAVVGPEFIVLSSCWMP